MFPRPTDPVQKLAQGHHRKGPEPVLGQHAEQGCVRVRPGRQRVGVEHHFHASASIRENSRSIADWIRRNSPLASLGGGTGQPLPWLRRCLEVCSRSTSVRNVLSESPRLEASAWAARNTLSGISTVVFIPEHSRNCAARSIADPFSAEGTSRSPQRDRLKPQRTASERPARLHPRQPQSASRASSICYGNASTADSISASVLMARELSQPSRQQQDSKALDRETIYPSAPHN